MRGLDNKRKHGTIDVSSMPRRTKSEELIDFEIYFYERLLSAYPDFSDVLIPLAEAYTRRGLHDKGLAVDLRLTQLRSQDPVAWYNLACSYSLLKRLHESIEALRRSFELGYADFNHLRRDPDLTNIRQVPEYKQLMDSVVSLKARPVASTPNPLPPTGGASNP